MIQYVTNTFIRLELPEVLQYDFIEIDIPNIAWFAYFEENKPVAIIGLYEEYALVGLYVKDTHRGKGIAKDLIKYAMSTATQRMLWTCARYPNIFLDLGWEETGEIYKGFAVLTFDRSDGFIK